MKNTLNVILGFALLGLMAWGAYLFLTIVVAGLERGGGTAQAIVLFLTGAGGLVALWGRSNIEKRRDLEKLLAGEKRKHYQTYVDFMRRVAGSTQGDESINQPELLHELRKWSFDAMLIASDDVMRAHSRFVRVSGREDAKEWVVPAVVDVLLALRRDAGMSRTKVTLRELAEMFIRFPDVNSFAFIEWDKVKRNL